MAAKASSTTNKYIASWTKWENWANSKNRIHTIPAAPFHLTLYIIHLSATSEAKTAADAFAASIKWVHSRAPISYGHPMFKLALQGYKRLHATPVKRKEPISSNILEKLLVSHGHPTATLTDLRTLFICLIT